MTDNVVGRWPSRRHIFALLVMYLVVGAMAGLIFLLGAVAVSYPEGSAIFAGGVLTGWAVFYGSRVASRRFPLKQLWRQRIA